MCTMARDRLDLQDKLEALNLGKVYYQPPASFRLSYPCIIYEDARNEVTYASNKAYNITPQYTLTYVAKDPDEAHNSIKTVIRAFEMCSHNRSYVADNLNHEVFSLFY